MTACEPEKKAALDQAMRDVLRKMVVFDQGCAMFKQVIGLAVEAVMKALNLMSQFNLENVTVFASQNSSEPTVKQEKMDVEDGETEDTPSILIDYNLYRKFWSLQDYFRKPVQCYDKAAWRAFAMYSDEVLSAFSSCKLDDLMSQRKKLARRDDQSQNFFAKYLTSEKLLDLQLSDSNFRRYVLVQFLILFQYLTSTVRFKREPG
nr:hypothetical protein BaRGS_001629 [Batillaria attramentaria]